MARLTRKRVTVGAMLTVDDWEEEVAGKGRSRQTFRKLLSES